MASDSEGLRLISSITGLSWGLRWKWLPIRKGYDFSCSCSFCHVFLVENGFRFGRVTTNSCVTFSSFSILLKMASDSEGLRPITNVTSIGTFLGWKWLPIRKGYDKNYNFKFMFHANQLKMASDSEGLRPPLSRPGSDDRWKWLPIRKGYDFCFDYSDSYNHFCWKWLPIRKGYDKNPLPVICDKWRVLKHLPETLNPEPWTFLASDSEGLRLIPKMQVSIRLQ